MHCRRARKLVFEFLDGLSDETVRLELERHLSDCADCEKIASSLTRSMDMLHRVPHEKLDDNFNWKVRLAIHKEKNALQNQFSSSWSLFRSWNVRYTASAVAGFMGVVVIGVWALSSGIMTGGDNPISYDPSLNVSNNSQPANLPPTALSQRRVGDQPVLPVSGGDHVAGGQRTPGAIDLAQPEDLDSLIRSECETMDHEAHLESLRERIEILQNHLKKCEKHK